VLPIQRVFLICGLIVLAGPALARAQGAVDDPSSAARIHLGPLAVDPRFGLRNVGFDNNVFNARSEPTRDFTFTLVPGADTWLHVGRALLSGRTTVEWNYFRDSVRERSLNLNQEGRLDVDLTWFAPYVLGSYQRTRQRPNDEIDLRVLQKQTGRAAGLVVVVGPRLKLDFEARELTLDFSDSEFGSAALAEALNRTRAQGTLSVEFALTPLTTMAVRSVVREDRFEFSTLRDSDSWSVMPGFEFTPAALISGSAYVGMRELTTRSADVPDFSGIIAAVDLRYVVRDLFRVIARVDRDVDYSFDPAQPFFVSTAAGGEVTQVVGLNWDVVVRTRRTTLDYEGFEPAPGSGRRDLIWSHGVGIGRRVGTEVRVGFDVDYIKRDSDREIRVFDGFRFGGSVTYGY